MDSHVCARRSVGECESVGESVAETVGGLWVNVRLVYVWV